MTTLDAENLTLSEFRRLFKLERRLQGKMTSLLWLEALTEFEDRAR
jgi:hypothetical protein